MFHKCFTSVLLVFYQCFTNVSPVFHLWFTSVSPMFHQCFTGVSTVSHHWFTSDLPVIYQCFTIVSPMFHQCFNSVSPAFHQCFMNFFTPVLLNLHDFDHLAPSRSCCTSRNFYFQTRLYTPTLPPFLPPQRETILFCTQCLAIQFIFLLFIPKKLRTVPELFV